MVPMGNSMSGRKSGLVVVIAMMALGGCHTLTSGGEGFAAPTPTPSIRFANVTAQAGLPSQKGGKYNGPSIADIDHDGHYDLLLNNHDDWPYSLLWGQPDGSFRFDDRVFPRMDAHGAAPGDFDGDGDADLLIAVGGGNATDPKPPRLYRNDDGTMIDITNDSDIAGIGARGRAVRWVDLDSDGDLDLMEFNEHTPAIANEDLFPTFENLGNGRFRHRPVKGLAGTQSNKVLVFDFNGDHLADLLIYPEVKLFRGNGDFSFTDVTDSVLPKAARGAPYSVAAADPDIDNDGDADLYLAQGLSDLQMMTRGFVFRPDLRRFDLRQRGDSGGHDGLTFAADSVRVGRLGHVRYRFRTPIPLFLGASKTRMDLQNPTAESFEVRPDQAMGFPDEVTDETGWYLGYLGNGQWRFEWFLTDKAAWSIYATIEQVNAIVSPDWQTSEYGKPDLLLRNDGGVFTDISALLPPETREANHGVTYGDFDNDGLTDLFVFRFGHLGWRKPDWLLRNTGKGFELVKDHGGTDVSRGGNGDNGAAFDFNLDGALDLIAGDEDAGYWSLHKNLLEPSANANFVLVRVGYSPTGVDPIGAEIVVRSGDLTLTRRVGSAGESFSQSVLSIAHFGLGARSKVDSIQVRWRDGSTSETGELAAGHTHVIGSFPHGG